MNHFQLIVIKRIEDHKAAEAKRLEAETQRIRAEEEAKAAAKVKAEQEEASRAVAQAAATVAPVVDALMDKMLSPAAEPQAKDTVATIKIGDISQRLGFTVTADFLAGLGFEAKVQKNMRLYREADFPLICNALIRHITAAAHVDYRRAA